MMFSFSHIFFFLEIYHTTLKDYKILDAIRISYPLWAGLSEASGSHFRCRLPACPNYSVTWRGWNYSASRFTSPGSEVYLVYRICAKNKDENLIETNHDTCTSSKSYLDMPIIERSTESVYFGVDVTIICYSSIQVLGGTPGNEIYRLRRVRSS